MNQFQADVFTSRRNTDHFIEAGSDGSDGIDGIGAGVEHPAGNSIIAGITHYCSAVAMAAVGVCHKFGLPVIVWGAVLPEITYANDFKEIHRINVTMIN